MTSLADDDTHSRTAILDEEDDDQYLLTRACSEYVALTDQVFRRSSLGRHRRDWALEWLETAQHCYGHFVLRGAVLRALTQVNQAHQAEQEPAMPDVEQASADIQTATALSWQEYWAGALAFRVTRLSRELAASARLTTHERRALLDLMDDLRRAIDAAVLAAEAAWATLPDAARRRAAPLVTVGLKALDSSWNQPPGVPTDLLLPTQDLSLPPDPYQERPQPKWGDAPLAAVVMRPATIPHLTERGWTTLCGRMISPPLQVTTTFGRRGCKSCRRQAARQLLTCVACRQPRITEGSPGYCQPCSRKRLTIPLGALSLVGQVDRFVQEERGEW